MLKMVQVQKLEIMCDSVNTFQKVCYSQESVWRYGLFTLVQAAFVCFGVAVVVFGRGPALIMGYNLLPSWILFSPNNGKDYWSLCPQNHFQDPNPFFLLVTVWEEYCHWWLFFSFPGVLKYGDVNQVVANPQTWSFVSQLDNKVWTKWCMKHWPINFITNRSESKKLTWGDLILSKKKYWIIYNGFELMAGSNKIMRENGIGYWSYNVFYVV